MALKIQRVNKVVGKVFDTVLEETDEDKIIIEVFENVLVRILDSENPSEDGTNIEVWINIDS